jgi:hypothetical protein
MTNRVPQVRTTLSSRSGLEVGQHLNEQANP